MFETAVAPPGLGRNLGAAEAFAHPGSRSSTFPRVPLLLPLGFLLGWGFFFFFFHLLANTEMSGLGPVPFADPLPAALPPVWKQQGGRGQLWQQGDISLGRQAASPCAQHRSVSPKTSCPPAARYFPALTEPKLQITPVSQQGEELREQPRKWEATPVGILGSSRVGDAPGERGRFPVAGSPRLCRARAALQLSVFAREPRQSGLCAPGYSKP